MRGLACARLREDDEIGLAVPITAQPEGVIAGDEHDSSASSGRAPDWRMSGKASSAVRAGLLIHCHGLECADRLRTMTTAAQTRTLVLMRHAQAVTGIGRADHDRPLSAHGARQARSAGQWLHEQGLGADLAWCSTAERTRETLQGLAAGGESEAQIEFDGRIYNAGVEQLLAVLHESDESADVVLLVGHAPGVPRLASLLTDGDGDEAAHEALSQGFAPATIATISYQGAWRDLNWGTGFLRAVHLPAQG